MIARFSSRYSVSKNQVSKIGSRLECSKRITGEECETGDITFLQVQGLGLADGTLDLNVAKENTRERR